MHPKKQQILDALAKLGPAKPFVLADKVGLTAAVCSYHLRGLLKDGEVKASGVSNDRVYALPAQKLDAPPQRRKPAGKGKAARRASTPRARPAAPAAPFLPAFTADQRMVLVGEGAPQIFTAEQTKAIADLLLNHFEA